MIPLTRLILLTKKTSDNISATSATSNWDISWTLSGSFNNKYRLYIGILKEHQYYIIWNLVGSINIK